MYARRTSRTLALEAACGPAPGVVLTVAHGPYLLEVTLWPGGQRETKLVTTTVQYKETPKNGQRPQHPGGKHDGHG